MAAVVRSAFLQAPRLHLLIKGDVNLGACAALQGRILHLSWWSGSVFLTHLHLLQGRLAAPPGHLGRRMPGKADWSLCYHAFAMSSTTTTGWNWSGATSRRAAAARTSRSAAGWSLRPRSPLHAFPPVSVEHAARGAARRCGNSGTSKPGSSCFPIIRCPSKTR